MNTETIEVADEVVDRAEIKDGAVLVEYNRTAAALADLAARIKAEQEAEAARLEAARIEQQRIAAEQAEQARLLREAAERLEAERLAAQQEIQRQQEEAQRQRELADQQAREQREAEQRLIDQQRAELERQQAADEAARQAIAQAAAKQDTQEQAPQQVLKAEPATADATDRGTPAITSPRVGAMGAGQAADAAPKADEPATLKLGVICERLGFTVNAAFLADVLHIQPAATDRAAKLYRESQWPLICQQLQAHIGAMAELYGREVV